MQYLVVITGNLRCDHPANEGFWGMQRSGDGAIDRRKIGAVERQNLQPLLVLRAFCLPQHWTKRTDPYNVPCSISAR